MYIPACLTNSSKIWQLITFQGGCNAKCMPPPLFYIYVDVMQNACPPSSTYLWMMVLPAADPFIPLVLGVLRYTVLHYCDCPL